MTAPLTVGPVATAFPETACAVTELAELAELTDKRRAHALALGIDTVRVGAAEADYDLAVTAAEKALDRAGLAARDLDALLVVGGRAPRYLMSSEATRLQHRLGAERAFVAGVGDLGCASISAAFTLATGLLRGDSRCGSVLLVAAAAAPTRFRYRAPMTVLGDGAAAVLLGTGDSGRYEFVDHLVRSDGKYSELFRIDYRDVPQRDWREECADEATYSFRLAVESRKRLAAMTGELLDRNGLRLEEVGPILMQNLSAGAFAFWEEALGVRVDPACARNLTEFGHLGSVDVLVNLEAAAPGRAPGDYTLLLNSSPVAAWSATLLRRLPDRLEGIEL
ncbi:3-oxoacyl-ACP synthase [Nocardia sp. NPDC048505]|uniref:3-oxoacyl-ACP synthase n=1 Tax=unclassified Nocardia TaxID=2637762 RepID=UPI0034108F5B